LRDRDEAGEAPPDRPEDDPDREHAGRGPRSARPVPYRDIFRVFLKAGLAFGGGLGILAVLEDELVTRRRVIPREEFLSTYGLGRIVPAGTMTALAVAYGYRLGGWPGTAVALFAMVLPGFSITVLLTLAYQLIQRGELFSWLQVSILPAALAFITVAALRLGREVARPAPDILIALAVFLVYAFAIARVVPGQANVYVASIGTMLFGLPGAVLTTVAIQLPGYLMLPLLRGYEALRKSRAVASFIRGLTGASVGLIFAALIGIGRRSLTDWMAIATFLITLGLIYLAKLGPIASLFLAGGAGIVLKLLFQGAG
jgi:chromate transporter